MVFEFLYALPAPPMPIPLGLPSPAPNVRLTPQQWYDAWENDQMLQATHDLKWVIPGVILEVKERADSPGATPYRDRGAYLWYIQTPLGVAMLVIRQDPAAWS